MGASAWEYAVPYEPDLAHALEQLRLKVFSDGDFESPESSGLPAPGSLEELMTEPYWEFLGTCGTHSILDIAGGIAPADDVDREFGTIRPLSSEETAELFGSAHPTRADFSRVSESRELYEYCGGGPYTGRAAIVHDAGQPAEIVFWGQSGD